MKQETRDSMMFLGLLLASSAGAKNIFSLNNLFATGIWIFAMAILAIFSIAFWIKSLRP
jgi:hypothetical protein